MKINVKSVLATMFAIAAPTLVYAADNCIEIVESTNSRGETVTTSAMVPCRGSDRDGTIYRVRQNFAGGQWWSRQWTAPYGGTGTQSGGGSSSSTSGSSSSSSSSSGGTGAGTSTSTIGTSSPNQPKTGSTTQLRPGANTPR